MSNFVHVIGESKKIRLQILEELEAIERILDQGLPCLTQVGDDLKTITWTPTVLGVSVRSGLQGMIRRIILDACKRAESMGPGSSELVVPWIVSLGKENIGKTLSGIDSRECEESIQNASGELLKNQLLVTKSLNQKALQNQIRQLAEHPKVSSMVWESIQLAGMEGKIFVDTEPSENCLVELSRGFIFDVAPYDEMIRTNVKWAESNVKIMVIDGMIESVSEIHKILTESSKDKQPLVIFARGFSEEVVGTLSVNRLRETLNVIPVRVPFDEISANTIKDISVVCNSHVISSLTGDLISSANWEDLPTVERVIFEKGKTLIENEAGLRSAAMLSTELLERRKTTDSLPLINLLDSRIRSLSSRSVRIRYDNNFVQNVSTIDLLLRTSKSILEHGVVEIDDIQKLVNPCLKHAFTKSINKSSFHGILPTLTFLSTVKHGTQATKSLLSINAALLLDEVM